MGASAVQDLSARTRQCWLWKIKVHFVPLEGTIAQQNFHFSSIFFFPQDFSDIFSSNQKKLESTLESYLSIYLNRTFYALCKLENLLREFSKNFVDIDL